MKRLIAILAVAVASAGCIAPPPAPPAAPRPCVDPQSSVEQAIDCAFGSLGLARQNEAHTVAWCESTFDPNASNSGVYLGLFQLHHERYAATVAFYGGDFYNAYTNAQTARDSVAANGGWSRWECQP